MANGQAIRVYYLAPGNDADVDLFTRGFDNEKFLLCKHKDKKNVMDGGLYGTEFEDTWRVLCDKGYQEF